MSTYRIEGADELDRQLRRLGTIPAKVVNKSAKKGMNIALVKSKGKAPTDTGNLKKGMKLVKEKSKYKAKAIYRIVFDKSMNDVFQKKDASGKVTGYYPVSQEYGYFAKNGRYIPGFYFIRDTFQSNTEKISQTILQQALKEIDKVLNS